MIFTRRQRRAVTWFALVAMLALALMPALSHAMASASGGSVFDEICSAGGSRPQTEAPATGIAFGHLDHCPFCHLQADTLAPPAATPLLLRTDLAQPAPSRFFSAPRTPFAWRTAQPRAPPAVS